VGLCYQEVMQSFCDCSDPGMRVLFVDLGLHEEPRGVGGQVRCLAKSQH
jgi:hypothetical protein